MDSLEFIKFKQDKCTNLRYHKTRAHFHEIICLVQNKKTQGRLLLMILVQERWNKMIQSIWMQ